MIKNSFLCSISLFNLHSSIQITNILEETKNQSSSTFSESKRKFSLLELQLDNLIVKTLNWRFTARNEKFYPEGFLVWFFFHAQVITDCISVFCGLFDFNHIHSHCLGEAWKKKRKFSVVIFALISYITKIFLLVVFHVALI